MYLITNEQFIDVVKQENGKDDIEIDVDAAISKGSNVFINNFWYNTIHYLGARRGYPIFTFTHDIDYEIYNKPDQNYLKIIIEGIKEAFPNYSDTEILIYLFSKKGIAGKYSKEELLGLIKNKQLVSWLNSIPSNKITISLLAFN
ncbi:MAG: hypothetical protein IPQ02_08600 [Saprospiraceae bacterium]|nr:hypothetical protein [Candidatus Defluviibacterium haderslevense]